MAKILLVEDDNNLREIFEMRLVAEGYTVVTAGNGEEGLVVAMQEKPDLIISDVMMPKLSGFEMLETLRAAPEMAGVKTIMMTALGQSEDRARGEQLGVVKYLVKSQVTLEDFVKVVRGVVSPDGSSAPTPATQVQNNQESEASMQEDNTQQTPAPAPSDGAAPNPIADPAAGSSPMDGQQSAAQEQNAVADQINSFVASAPAEPAAAPATDPMPSAPAPQPVTDPMPAAPADPAPAPGGDASTPAPAPSDTGAPSFPVATPPAEPAPQPPTETGPADAAPTSNTL